MMNGYTKIQKNLLYLAAFGVCFHLSTHPVWSANALMMDPPVIIGVPNDTIVDCITDIPGAPNLMATDDDDPSFPKMITPTDQAESGFIQTCTGGTLLRIWRAEDMSGNITSDTQRIEVLPDIAPPVVTLPSVFDTVSCELANDPMHPMSYENWKADQELLIASNLGFAITDSCSGINTYSFEPTEGFMDPCGTRQLTFTITDNCSNAVTWEAFYTTIDTISPTLVNIPTDTTVSCSNLIPEVPTIVVSDNCTSGLQASLTEETTQILDGSCDEFEYTIRRIWSVMDSCGNMAQAEQLITVVDTLFPEFTVPDDVVIDCTTDDQDLSLTGEPTIVADGCGANPSVSYSDQRSLGACKFDTLIIRTWQVVDPCGNLSTKTQRIEKRDLEAPNFEVPADTTIDCSLAEQIDLTGRPSGITDNCDSGPYIVTFSDIVTPSPQCEGMYTIRRSWSVADSCGNARILDQMIMVEDQQEPVFTRNPENRTIDCLDGVVLEDEFDDWVMSFGNATYQDNCSDSVQIITSVLDLGTNVPPTLSAIRCQMDSDTLIHQGVVFVVTDQCGNEARDTAYFRVMDQNPPQILSCAGDTIIGTLPGQCSASYSFTAPLFEEGCGDVLSNQSLDDSEVLTSNANPGEEGDTPVNEVMLSFPVTGNIPVNAFSPGSLMISLQNADAEAEDEFFFIYGEGGELIGQTAFSAVSCGNSDTTFTLSENQLNSWAQDGVIDILLVPNTPADKSGRFAINDICAGGTTVAGNVTFLAKDLSNVGFQYRINDEALRSGRFDQNNTVTLEEGIHRMTYVISDCAGNMDSCSYTISVMDVEPPVFDCPPNIDRVLQEGVCQDTLELPFLMTVTDNCGNLGSYQETLPADTAAAYWRYDLDPNLNEYLARPKTYDFLNVAGNAISEVTLEVYIKGDFNTSMAIITILDEEGQELGTTSEGVATCDQEGVLSITIAADRFNELANDGIFSITIMPKDILVPPGVAGDGINPCMPGLVTSNGATDSIGYAFATLSYGEITPTYFVDGATTIGLTPIAQPMVNPVLTFNQGSSFVHYVVADLQGNVDTCQFEVTVRDEEAPTAVCQGTTVFINPSGLDFQEINAMEIDGGSFDNCGIDTMFLNQTQFSCNDAGTTVNITLTVIDSAGNQDVCTRPIRIEAAAPEPTANSGLCGGDSLFLFANPPEAVGGVVFTYEWYNASNLLISTTENPVITNISASDAGSYRVEITGVTGCTSVGVVQVVIEDLPITPAIIADDAICTNEAIVMESSEVPTGSNAQYRWYQGSPANAVLIANTSNPTLTIPGPHDLGSQSYFLEIEASGCISRPSVVKTIEVLEVPAAVVNDNEITICSGESINLGTTVTGPDFNYTWTGPNGFSAEVAFPMAISPTTLNDAGVYRLVISNPGCSSAPANTLVNIRPTPSQPLLSSNGPLCRGEQLTLTVNNDDATVYEWISPSLASFFTSENSFEIENSDFDDAGFWQVAVTQFECRSVLSAPINVSVNAVPNAVASATTPSVCQGSDLQLQGGPDLPGAIYEWSGPLGFESVSRNPVVSNFSALNAGTYNFKITTAAGCSDESFIDIEELDEVVITAVSNDAPLCLRGNTDIRLVATVFPVDQGGYTYRWEGPNGFRSNDSVAVIPNATSMQNGTYSLTVMNGDGCASNTLSTTVDVMDPPAIPTRPALSAGEGSSVCAGDVVNIETSIYNGNQILYRWTTPSGIIETTNPILRINEVSMADAGQYTVVVQIDDCVTQPSPTFNLVVNPIPEINVTSNSPVCSGNDIQLNASGLESSIYNWSGPGDFTSSRLDPKIQLADSVRHTGIYTVISIVNGCTSVPESVEVVVLNTPPTPVIHAEQTSVCIDQPGAILRLNIDSTTAMAGAAYSWFDDFGELGPEVSALNIGIKDYSPYSEGDFSFRVQARSGACLSAISEPFNVTFSEIPPSSAFAGEDQEVCVENLIELNGTPPSRGTGTWTIVGGPTQGVTIANPDQANSPVEGLIAGQSYLFRWTLSNGACEDYSSDDVLLMVVESEAPNAGIDQLVCSEDTIQLDAVVPVNGMGQWSQSGGQSGLGVTIEDINDPNTVVRGLEPGNLYAFTWTLTSSCGAFPDVVTVQVSDPNPFAGPDQLICNDDASTMLLGDVPLDGSRGVWSSLTNSIVFADVDDPNTVASNLSIGENVMIWTIDEGICKEQSRDTVVLDYYVPPKAVDDQFDLLFEQSDTIQVLANDEFMRTASLAIVSEPANGQLTILEDLSIAYVPNLSYVGPDEFIYELCNDGCECARGVVRVQVGSDATCDAPNIFTPNNDGINDEFVIPCLLDLNQFPESQLRVFGRWGDEVYRSEVPYLNDWKGTYNGSPLPVGVYYYVIDYGSDRLPTKGFIEIIR